MTESSIPDEPKDEPKDGSGPRAHLSAATRHYSTPSPSEESTPLLPGKETHWRTSLASYGPIVLALFLVGNLIMHFAFCPVYPWTMNAVRLAWVNETAQHDIWRQGWVQEKEEHAAARQVAEEFDRKAARRVREEEERYERVRNVWEREVRKHEEEVAYRIDEERQRQERIRREWTLEDEKHRQEREEIERRESQHREDERRKWHREVEDHDRIEEERKKEKERREKEKERRKKEKERQKLNMFWGDVKALTCTSFATREYTAQLMNLPMTWEHRVEACKTTSLEINGVSYLPKTCKDKGPGVVIGRWEINLHEPDCATFWDSYNDKGCTSPGSGKKYVTHKLENLPQNGDWRKFCATTPIRFEHRLFQGAQECFQTIWGVYGQWELDDRLNC